MHGIGDHFTTTIGKNIHNLDGFDCPEGDGSSNDKQPPKETHLAGNYYRQVKRFTPGPGDIELGEAISQNDSPL